MFGNDCKNLGKNWKIKVGPAINTSSILLDWLWAIAPMPPKTVHVVNKATIAVPIIIINPLLVLLVPIGAWLEKIIITPIQVESIKKACPKASVQMLLVKILSVLKVNIVCKPVRAPGNVKT